MISSDKDVILDFSFKDDDFEITPDFQHNINILEKFMEKRDVSSIFNFFLNNTPLPFNLWDTQFFYNFLNFYLDISRQYIDSEINHQYIFVLRYILNPSSLLKQSFLERVDNLSDFFSVRKFEFISSDYINEVLLLLHILVFELRYLNNINNVVNKRKQIMSTINFFHVIIRDNKQYQCNLYNMLLLFKICISVFEEDYCLVFVSFIKEYLHVGKIDDKDNIRLIFETFDILADYTSSLSSDIFDIITSLILHNSNQNNLVDFIKNISSSNMSTYATTRCLDLVISYAKSGYFLKYDFDESINLLDVFLRYFKSETCFLIKAKIITIIYHFIYTYFDFHRFPLILNLFNKYDLIDDLCEMFESSNENSTISLLLDLIQRYMYSRGLDVPLSIENITSNYIDVFNA